MPEISRFLGIVVRMYYSDHPPPHFHARYGGHRVVVYLEDRVVGGTFPKRALRHLLEWHGLHRKELEDDWDRAR